MILAVETATEVCSVALRLTGGEVVERRKTGRGIHSEQLFLSIQQLLEEHRTSHGELREVLISRGPGQYTGLRIGAAGLKGLLFDSTVPLYALGTLEGFAAGVICVNGFQGRLHAILDARREHLYHQIVDADNKGITFGKAGIREIAAVDRELNSGDHVVGTGAGRLSGYDDPSLTFYGQDSVSAVNLIHARLDCRFAGRFERVDPALFEPEYLTVGQINEDKSNNGTGT